MAGKSSEQWLALLDGKLEGLEDMRTAAGELLVSLTTAAKAGLDTTGRERRTLELKGRAEPIEVVVLDARPGKAAA